MHFRRQLNLNARCPQPTVALKLGNRKVKVGAGCWERAIPTRLQALFSHGGREKQTPYPQELNVGATERQVAGGKHRVDPKGRSSAPFVLPQLLKVSLAFPHRRHVHCRKRVMPHSLHAGWDVTRRQRHQLTDRWDDATACQLLLRNGPASCILQQC